MEEVRLEKARWTVTEVLGRGGGGEVRAASSTLLTSAAAKFLPLGPAMPREMVFGTETAGARNVVPVIDQGRTATHWVIVMPRADRSLEQEIRGFDGPMPLDRALSILRDVATTLHDLHGRVVHRDVKPANVLLLDGRWQLTDFGIARYHDARTATHTKKAAYSQEYAAPERWRGEHATPATDVYSWGVVAYELLTGNPPFLGPARSDYQAQHLHEPPPPLTGLPAALEALVDECLFKDVGSRPLPTEVLDRLLGLRDADSPGISRVRGFHRDDVRARAGKQAGKSARQSDKQRREQLQRDARASFRRLSNTLWEALTRAGAKHDRSFDDDLGWRLILGPARLTVTHPRPARKSAFGPLAGSPPRVAAQAKIDLTQPSSDTGYAGRAHSLWFTDLSRPGTYRWHELGFLHAGFPRRISAHMPFALEPDEETRRIAAAGPGRFVLCGEPVLLEYSTSPLFVDRWARWFGDGAGGTLSYG
jgi:eukaryotic-like serine/threonine-protein kinase